MDWKGILKSNRMSARLRRYANYARSSQHDFRNRMTMEEFAERVHTQLNLLSSIPPKPIEEAIFDEINSLDESDRSMPFDIPFSYEEYMEKFGNKMLEEVEKYLEYGRRREADRQRRRAKKLEEIRSRRTPDYYSQQGPKSLRSPETEEE